LPTTSSNNRVIIIGATSGIGRALANLYATAGWKLGITGRRNELLDSFVGEQRKINPDAFIVSRCFDVRANDNISNLNQIIEQLGGLDLLIYNSGYGDASESLDWNIEKRTYETNVKGFIEIVHFAYAYFEQQGYGHIAATSSIASIRGNRHAPGYSASKAFMSTYLEGLFMRSLKTKNRVHVTDIQPGFVDTHPMEGTRFWVAPVEKAARQIFKSIQQKRFRVYITKRWWIIAQLLKWIPAWIYRRI
jgi:short-subunit dehydrogenase